MSVYRPQDWDTQDAYLQRLAGTSRVTDDLVDRLKVKLVRHILDSHIFFQRNYAMCVDKYTDELVLSDPWFGQTGLDYTIEAQRRAGYAQRIVEIKPRQVGWTQSLLSRGVWTCLHPNKNVVVFVPDQDVVRKTMNRVGVILNNLPQWLQPMRRIDNVNLIEFDNPNHRERDLNPGLGSSFACVVPADFRGATNLNFVPLSEFAKYHKSINVQAFLDALLSGIGQSDNTCVIIDTTPMGHDMYYEPLAMTACERNPKWVKNWYSKQPRTREEIINGILGEPDNPDDWVPYFTRWVDHEPYTTKDDTPRGELPKMKPAQIDAMKHGDKGISRIGTVDRFGNDEENWLQKEHHATLGQLFWRRKKIDGNPGPDWRYRKIAFDQEFAITHEQCFVSYGVTPFDPKCLDAIHRMIKEPYGQGIFRQDPDKGIYLDTDYHSDWEEVRLWTTPTPGESYIIGVDVAHAYENAEADDTFAQVLRRRDQKQVAVYQAKVPPYKLIQQLYLIYKFYNDALLAVETEDGIAYDIVRQLFDMGATNQYYWKRIDADVPKMTDYLGWETNPRTRGPMQETLVKEISNVLPDGTPSPNLIIRDLETYRQVVNLERDQDGTIAGSGKTHDDAAVSLMITVYVNNDMWHAYALPGKTEQKRELNALMSEYSGQFGDQDKSFVEDGVGVGSERASA